MLLISAVYSKMWPMINKLHLDWEAPPRTINTWWEVKLRPSLNVLNLSLASTSTVPCGDPGNYASIAIITGYMGSWGHTVFKQPAQCKPCLLVAGLC